MEARLRYFEGCPHWRTMYYRLRSALRAEGMWTTELILEPVGTPDAPGGGLQEVVRGS